MKARTYAAVMVALTGLVGAGAYYLIPPFGVMAGVNILLALGLVMLIPNIGQIKFIVDMWKNAPEAWVFKESRETELPVLEDMDVGSHRARYILGNRDEDYHIKFETDYGSVKLDPSLTTGGAHPSIHPYGLSIYRYASLFWLPITERNALAYQKILKMRHDGIFKVLDFLSDADLMQLLNTPRKNLMKDLGIFIRKYSPEWKNVEKISMDDEKLLLEFEKDTGLMELMKKKGKKDDPIRTKISSGFGPMEESDLFELVALFQQKLMRVQTETGFFCFEDAFTNIPFAHAPQDFEHAEMLIKKRADQEWMDKINLMTYGVIFAGIAGAVTVCIAVLHYVFA